MEGFFRTTKNGKAAKDSTESHTIGQETSECFYDCSQESPRRGPADQQQQSAGARSYLGIIQDLFLTKFLNKVFKIPVDICSSLVERLISLISSNFSYSQLAASNISNNISSSIIKILFDFFDYIKPHIKNLYDLFMLLFDFLDIFSSVSGVGLIVGGSGLITPATNFKIYIVLIRFIERLYAYLCKVMSVNPVNAQSFSYTEIFTNVCLMSILPDYVKKFFRDLSIFSNVKLFDSSYFMYDVCNFIIDVPRVILSLFFTDMTWYKDPFEQLEYYLPIAGKGKMLKRVQSLVQSYSLKPECVYSESFLSTYDEVSIPFYEYLDGLFAFRGMLPPFLRELKMKFDIIRKKVINSRSNTRAEPVFCVFLGPPGCGKSYTLSKLLTRLKNTNSIYTHSSPGERDFYDHYNDETIFAADDVGQKGISQWSGFIEMVSTVKYPLNCAEAFNKGTRFFNSSLIMVTTNSINFSLTQDCGISDLEALHRRMDLFDFSNCTILRNPCEPITYSGYIIYKRYNLQAHRFDDIANIPLNSDYCTAIKDILYDRIAFKKQVYSNMISENENVFYEAIPQDGFVSWIFEDFPAMAREYADFFSSNFATLCFLAAGQSLNNNFMPQPSFAFSGLQTVLTVANVCVLGWFMIGIVSRISKMIASGVGSVFESLSSFIFPTTATKLKDDVKHIPAYTSEKLKPFKNNKVVDIFPQSLDRVYNLRSPVPPPTNLTKFVNNTRGIKFHYINIMDQQVVNSVVGVFSGRFFSTVYHAVREKPGSDVVASVFDKTKTTFHDKVFVTRVYSNEKDDITIWSLPLRLPQYAQSLNRPVFHPAASKYLTTPAAILPMDGNLHLSDISTHYVKLDYANVMEPGTYLYSTYEVDSLCGSWLINSDGFPYGHHVAQAISNSGETAGIIKIFTQSTIDAIDKFMYQRSEFFVKPSDVQTQDNAVALDVNNVSMPSTKSTLTPSLVAGVFENGRSPANFSNKPLVKMKEIADGAFKETIMPSMRSFDFIRHEIDSLLSGWEPRVVDDCEVINGTEFTGKIDKDTSVGFGLPGSKEDYIDYQNNCFYSHFNDLMVKFEKDVLNDVYPEFYFADQLKDELRDNDKVDKPRVFRMSPLVHTVLGRRYLLSLMDYFANIEVRFRSGIMVGINPFSKQWSRLCSTITRFGDNVFDGDYSKFDKNMLPTFQMIINQSILKRFKIKYSDTSNEFKMCDFLLNSIMCNPCVSGDRTFVTTHSLPSGAFITSIYNSLVNKAYIAYSYYESYFESFSKYPTLMDFHNNVTSCVYGDDVLIGVSNAYKEHFNGPVMQKWMQRVGLDFTPGSKGEWTYKTRSIYDCTFLKRGFSFHYVISDIVAPLQLNSMCSTLNWVRDATRNDELSLIKLQNFQREAYLYDRGYASTTYSDLMSRLLKFLEKIKYEFLPLSDDYLLSLYQEDKFVELLNMH